MVIGSSMVIAQQQREFELTDDDFRCLRNFVTEHSGIVVDDGKRDMIYSRLSRRLRALGLTCFAEYCTYLRTHEDDELTELINAVTTNLTNFFREAHHFEHLKHRVIPNLLEQNAEQRRIRIWSAGCSTGEEPYSLAMALEEAIPPWMDWDVKILATDVDTQVLETGRKGVYKRDQLRGVGEERIRRFFLRGRGKLDGLVRVDPELRQMISFKPLNLLKHWPMRGPFDAIFCRNVMIYFDKETQKRLVERFAHILAPHGFLYIGHSETLSGLSNRFDLAGHTIYRRKD